MLLLSCFCLVEICTRTACECSDSCASYSAIRAAQVAGAASVLQQCWVLSKRGLVKARGDSPGEQQQVCQCCVTAAQKQNGSDFGCGVSSAPAE